jgi:hypothetical protein
MRLDLFDLVHRTTRPNLMIAEDIGSWQTVFQTMCTICIVTHAGLIVYTMDTRVSGWSPSGKAFVFIGYQVLSL